MNSTTFGLNLVLGSSISAEYFNVFKTAQERVLMFGKSVDLANAKIDNINAIKKHTNSLKKLKEEKLKIATTSSKVAFGILREAEALAAIALFYQGIII